jgi:long-subunit fatty acid transport protein
MTVKFRIYFQTDAFEAPVLAFNWTRDSAAGIERAKRDAAAFGYNPASMTFFAQDVATGDIVAFG